MSPPGAGLANRFAGDVVFSPGECQSCQARLVQEAVNPRRQRYPLVLTRLPRQSRRWTGWRLISALFCALLSALGAPSCGPAPEPASDVSQQPTGEVVTVEVPRLPAAQIPKAAAAQTEEQDAMDSAEPPRHKPPRPLDDAHTADARRRIQEMQAHLEHCHQRYGSGVGMHRAVFELTVVEDGSVRRAEVVDGNPEPVVAACFQQLFLQQRFAPPRHGGGRIRGAKIRVPIKYGYAP